MHLLDGIYNAADYFFRVGRAEGTVGAIDGGLDDGVGVFDRFDEGGVRCGIALGDTQARVVAQLGRQFGRVAEKCCDLVLLAKARREGRRADPTLKEGLSVPCCFLLGDRCAGGEPVPAAPMMRIFMDVSGVRVSRYAIEMATEELLA